MQSTSGDYLKYFKISLDSSKITKLANIYDTENNFNADSINSNNNSNQNSKTVANPEIGVKLYIIALIIVLIISVLLQGIIIKKHLLVY